MNKELRALEEWTRECAEALGMSDVALDLESIHILLDLARDGAHEIVRPASPLTTFMVGVAVGRGQSLGRAAAVATEAVLARGAAHRQERQGPTVGEAG